MIASVHGDRLAHTDAIRGALTVPQLMSAARKVAHDERAIEDVDGFDNAIDPSGWRCRYQASLDEVERVSWCKTGARSARAAHARRTLPHLGGVCGTVAERHGKILSMECSAHATWQQLFATARASHGDILAAFLVFRRHKCLRTETDPHIPGQ